MQLQHPLGVVTPTVDGDVLAVLAGADAEFTPPQVAALVPAWSEAGVRRSLARLVAQGIVQRRPAGRAQLHRLNREHLAAAAIVELAGLRGTYLARLRELLASWEVPCVFAAVFGSAARSAMDADSDIDLFVVRADHIDPDDALWRDQLADLSTTSTAWTGNDTRILEFSHREVQGALNRKDPVVIDVATDGIPTAGRSSYLRSKQRSA